jgi:uncharacterized protein YndB with AHSA1/START domain
VIPPLELDYEIDCSPEHAFTMWTERFGSWWPRGHTVSGDPATDVVLEPKVGGRIFERSPEGAEIDWGEITAWDAPRQLSYLWHLSRDRSDATDVTITFVPLDDGRTRVEILHRGWERLGSDGPSYRDANINGWGSLLPHFVEACEVS